MSEMFVTKRNGETQPFLLNKINDICKYVCRDLSDVDPGLLASEVSKQVYPGIHTDTIYEIIVLTARTMMVNDDPNYSYVAARTLLLKLNREVVGRSIKDSEKDGLYRQAFIDNVHLMVQEGLLSDKLLDFDLPDLAAYLKIERDQIIKYPGIVTLYNNYLVHKDGRHLESLQGFFMRVAMGLSLNETDKMYWAKRFYDKFSLFKYLPSTPTMFNSGTRQSQLSSCYLSTIPDDLESIFGGILSQANLSKWAGGLAVDWTDVRAIGAWIKKTNGPSSGLIPWLKIYNDTVLAVNQGSKRKGSGVAYLEFWHFEIEEFLELRKNTGDERRRTKEINTANWIPDLFIERLEADGVWTLFSPDETPDLHTLVGASFKKRYEEYESLAEQGKIKLFKKIQAKSLWRKALTAIVETGHPWICFKDPSNLRYSNQHVGVVKSSNLCNEIILHTEPTIWHEESIVKLGETAVCSLASINDMTHLNEDGSINWEELDDTVFVAIRGLDNSVDLNYYPTKASANSHLKHRPLGLGQMGWANLIQRLNIVFDSDEALKLAELLQESISYFAIKASCQLAKERGKYSTYKGSEWDKGNLPIDTYIKLMKYRDSSYNKDVKDFETLNWDKLREDIKEYGVRNSNLTTLPPNACQLGTNKIQTCDGVKSIYEILAENDINFEAVEKENKPHWIYLRPFKVPTMNGEQTSNKIWFNGLQEVFEIEFEDGKIYSFTGNHKLRVVNNGVQKWKQVKNLTEDDEVVSI